MNLWISIGTSGVHILSAEDEHREELAHFPFR
jgi:hypothetical protein